MKSISKTLISLLMSAVLAFPLHLQSQETLASDTIMEAGANVACMDWQPIGVCFWLLCTFTGCSVETSVKVRHYIPDAVVSSYSVTGENPWEDVASFSPATSTAEEGGSNKEGSNEHLETQLLFKNVDIIGSPANQLFDSVQSEYICDPGATMLSPYFLSTIDPFWREELPEALLAVLNVNRRVAEGRSEWAPLYPRIGFVGNGHDYKSGAVSAQRAANIVSMDRQPHIYLSMVFDSAPGYWPPGEVVEGDETTHQWQQLLPSGNSDSCMVFPDEDDTTSLVGDPFADRLNQNDGYAFHLWRPYECCEPQGAFLYSVDFDDE